MGPANKRGTATPLAEPISQRRRVEQIVGPPTNFNANPHDAQEKRADEQDARDEAVWVEHEVEVKALA